MDFFKVKTRSPKRGETEVYPDFIVCRSKDLMVRGKAFYAVWDEAKGMWSQDEYDVQRLIDQELQAFADKMPHTEDQVTIKFTRNFSSASWLSFQKYMKNISDNMHRLDEKLTFQNTPVTKKDYVSKRLPYALEAGEYKAWDEMVSTLYEPEERQKIEWAIGAVVSGESKDIQKFMVLYGDPGAGKGTILKIIKKLFDGYTATFEASVLTSSSAAFNTEAFKDNPLVAIEEDSKLSRIENNTTLNSIVSHEDIIIKEKYKPSYSARINSFLFLASNEPVKITDAKSGLLRRLIDISPKPVRKTGVAPIGEKKYSALMNQINFELGAIAQHCLDVYQSLGKSYYNTYRPLNMMFKTDVFFNFVDDTYLTFAEQDGTSLKAAYKLYKDYCEESGSQSYRLPMYKFREELKNYFENFEEVARIDNKQVRSWFSGFLKDKFKKPEPPPEEHPYTMTLDKTKSLLDIYLADCPAQYANKYENPKAAWDTVTTKLSDIDTHKLHYVLLPEDKKHLIEIDFDIKNEDGTKNREKNLEEASKWPPTYAEFSKGGGIHLHYFYPGDISRLQNQYSKDIEVKAFTGKSSMRRKLTYCNDIPIATLSSGLKEKEEKMVDQKTIMDERHLRALIKKALRKETDCGGTKSNVDFIYKLLDDAYKSGMKYDVSDLYQSVLYFANCSTHHPLYCMQLVGKMKFQSETPSDGHLSYEAGELVFFDVEVFPNLTLIVWKPAGEGKPFVRMFNPKPEEVMELLKMKLVGFNCREYDNHILRAVMDGYSTQEIARLSNSIINNRTKVTWEAKNYSYTDVYDFCSKKQSLKKWEIELGIFHKELEFPWDQPVSEDKWPLVAEYCENDVAATEAVFNARQADWTARQILASIAGGSVNDTTNQLTTKIIFGNERNPQKDFNYRNLGKVEEYETYSMPWEDDKEFTLFGPDGNPVFPGYSYTEKEEEKTLKLQSGDVMTKKMRIRFSVYRGEEVGEGGYVYAEPGFYGNVALLDIASMHPSSIVAENLFGPYTAHFKDLMDARIAIKHKDFTKARTMMDGKLAPFLDDETRAKDLAGALKIAINSVYGLTSASFPNAFRDPRNVDNIVAKRGALFMVNLKHLVQKAGFTVAHIKTDSIKIPDATPEIIEMVKAYGRLYGYSFEHEATYEKMCLVNDAVYIAKEKDGEWTAVGAQFQHPYVFKKLFTKEPIRFEDLCEAKSAKVSMYLDFNEELPEGEHDYQFIGKVGNFCPIKAGRGGGELRRKVNDNKYDFVTGTKGYRWKEAIAVKALNLTDDIDYGYFDKLVNEAAKAVSQHVDIHWFASDAPYEPAHPTEDPPMCDKVPCGDGKYETCFDCPKFHPMDSVDPADYLATTCDDGYSLEQIYVTQEEGESA